MIEELYQRWLNHPHIDPQLKKELAGMSEKEKQDAFYTNIEFGTAGMARLVRRGHQTHQHPHDPQGERGLCPLHRRLRRGSDAAGRGDRLRQPPHVQ